MRSVFGSFAAAAVLALASAMPAGATVPVDLYGSYTFKLASGTSYTSTASGFKFTSTSSAGTTTATTGVGAVTLGVTASAWNITAASSNYAVKSGSLAQYAGGLGTTTTSNSNDVLGGTYNIVGQNGSGGSSYYTNASCTAAGSCLTHQVDNQNNSVLDANGNIVGTKSMDIIQLVFDRAVILNVVGTDAFGLLSSAQVTKNGKTYNKLIYDDDFSYGNGPNSLVNNTSLTGTQYNALWDGFRGDNGACTANAVASSMGVCEASTTVFASGDKSIASKTWYISAGAALSPQAGSDAIADAFKLNNITVFEYVKTLMFAPEPGTWMMMVFGFGAIGTSIRRRNAEERKALLTA